MDRKNLEITACNIAAMDSDPVVLGERAHALRAAAAAIADDYLDSLSEEFVVSGDFDNAVLYAADLLYRMGSPAFHQDEIAHAITNDVEYARLAKEPPQWLPDTDEKFALVSDLLRRGSLLSVEDRTPAYGPHVDGRNHECLDMTGSKYNKFGMWLPPQLG